ncbi:MAG: glycosyltransferase family 4 protein [Bacteroidales bacterium]
MKIAILTDTPPVMLGNKGEYNGRGWIDSFIICLAGSKEVDEIYVIYNSRVKQTVQKNGKITHIPVKNMLTYEFKLFNVIPRQLGLWESKKNIKHLNDAIAGINPDIIHVFGSEWYGIELLKYGYKNILVHIQGLASYWYLKYYPEMLSNSSSRIKLFIRSARKPKALIWGISYLHQNKALRLAAKREDKWLCQSNYCAGRTAFDKAYLKKINPDIEYFHINEILREPFYKSEKWICNPKENLLRISSVISDRVYKGYDLILNIAEQLDKQITFNIEWRIIGLTPDSECVNLFKKQTKLSKVKIILEGIQDEDKIIDTLLSGDIYLHPSHVENSSNSICEAQILGVPVIANNSGGTGSLIESGETGILFTDINAIANTISELRNNESLLVKLSQKGREAAMLRHNTDQIIEDTIAVYKSILRKI